MNEKCVHKRCASKPLDGHARCEIHVEHHRETQEARRLRFRANGLCGACGRPAVEGKARCEKHDSSLGVGRCGFCGGVGHNRTTCIERKQKNEVPKLHCKSCDQSVTATTDRDKWRDRCVRLIGHYGDKRTWECRADHEWHDVYRPATDGYDFAQAIKKEIDDEQV